MYLFSFPNLLILIIKLFIHVWFHLVVAVTRYVSIFMTFVTFNVIHRRLGLVSIWWSYKFDYRVMSILVVLAWNFTTTSHMSRIVTFVTFNIISQMIKFVDILLSYGISISKRSPRTIFISNIHATFYSSMSKPSTWITMTIQDSLIPQRKYSSKNCFPWFFLRVLISWFSGDI